MGVKSIDQEELGNILLLDTLQDELEIIFENVSGEDSKFVLKVFYNYEEVAFKVTSLEEEEFQDKYIFSLEHEKRIKIPIILSDEVIRKEDEQQGLLMFKIIQNPNDFQKEIVDSQSIIIIFMEFQLKLMYFLK